MVTLVFVAHPDDFVLGAGGIIAKQAKEGEHFAAVVFSYGEGSDLLKDPDTVKKRQRQDAKNAANALRIKDLIFLNINDLKFVKETKDPEVEQKVRGLIKTYRPDRIMTHTQDDLEPAHRAVSRIVIRAKRDLKSKANIQTFLTTNHVRWTDRIQPKMYVDISEQFNLKIETLKLFKHQKKFHPYTLTMTRLFNKLWGLRAGFKHAEMVFVVE